MSTYFSHSSSARYCSGGQLFEQFARRRPRASHHGCWQRDCARDLRRVFNPSHRDVRHEWSDVRSLVLSCASSILISCAGVFFLATEKTARQQDARFNSKLNPTPLVTATPTLDSQRSPLPKSRILGRCVRRSSGQGAPANRHTLAPDTALHYLGREGHAFELKRACRHKDFERDAFDVWPGKGSITVEA